MLPPAGRSLAWIPLLEDGIITKLSLQEPVKNLNRINERPATGSGQWLGALEPRAGWAGGASWLCHPWCMSFSEVASLTQFDHLQNAGNSDTFHGGQIHVAHLEKDLVPRVI